MNTKALLDSVPDYKVFKKMSELDESAHEISGKYGFEIKEVGKSELGHPLYLVRAGSGSKNAFVWGFPHPNEPVGSLAIECLLNYFGENREELEKSDYTWYCMFSADPDGTKLNEGWFNRPESIIEYFKGFYRPYASRQVDWTFPVKKNDFIWDNPTPETRVLIKLIDELKPSLMYPLHNAGFTGAYFLFNKNLGVEFNSKIHELTKQSGMPLHLGEPEDAFMKSYDKAIFSDFTFTDYYDQNKKLGGNPQKDLLHGDNSTGYLLSKNPDAFILKTEVAYFVDDVLTDQSESSLSRREVFQNNFNSRDQVSKIVLPIIKKSLDNLSEKTHYHDLMLGFYKEFTKDNASFRDYVNSNKEFERKATKAEVFSCLINDKFYLKGLFVGQIIRAAKEAKLSEEEIKPLQEIIECSFRSLEDETNYRTMPIKNIVQLQLGVLSESVNSLN